MIKIRTKRSITELIGGRNDAKESCKIYLQADHDEKQKKMKKKMKMKNVTEKS